MNEEHLLLLKEVAVNQKHIAEALALETEERKLGEKNLADAFDSLSSATSSALQKGHDRFRDLDTRLDKCNTEFQHHRSVAITTEGIQAWLKKYWWIILLGLFFGQDAIKAFVGRF